MRGMLSVICNDLIKMCFDLRYHCEVIELLINLMGTSGTYDDLTVIQEVKTHFYEVITCH
jgi:hypothetical protein